jgi:hypothetical protein
MQHVETKKWGFNVVPNIVEQHKPLSGFQYSIPFINYPGPECEGSKLLQNVTNYLPSNILNISDLPQHYRKNIRYGKCWPDDTIKLQVTLNSIGFSNINFLYSVLILYIKPFSTDFTTVFFSTGFNVYWQFNFHKICSCSRLNSCQTVPKRLLLLQTYSDPGQFSSSRWFKTNTACSPHLYSISILPIFRDVQRNY